MQDSLYVALSSQIALERRLQPLHGAIRRAVLKKQIGIEQRSLDFADDFFIFVDVAHQLALIRFAAHRFTERADFITAF